MIYNIRTFGAIGDGITDDTAAIQAAVDAARAAGGGSVYIPTGTYAVIGGIKASLGAILLYDNVTVYGDGMGASTVKLQDGWSGNITGIFRTPYGVENHDVTVHDLTIDGNRTNTSGDVYGWFNGVAPGQPGTDTNITLDRVEIMNCSGYGFDPHEQTTNLVITNSISHDNGLDGFALDFQIDARIENNIAYNNDRHGFNIVTSSNGIELIGNISYDNGGQGIVVQRGSSDIPVPDNILIQGGSIYNNGEDGIQINKADHVTVDGVEIYGNGQRGVRIMGSTGSVVENSFIHDNSQNKNLAYEEIRIESYDDTAGVSGRIYMTTGTVIDNNTITDSGEIRTNYAVREMAGVDYSTVSNNNIYGTGEDRALLLGSHSTFSWPDLNTNSTTDPHAPTIIYAPLLGQSNAELFKLTALDGGSGLSHVESGLKQQTDFSQVVTMTNMAVGGSTVDGDRSLNTNPDLIWWYPDQNRPGPALLLAVEQMQHQISELRMQGTVTPIVIWGQGEAEANQLGNSKSDSGRRLAEMEYINSTRLVFNYIQNHVDRGIQFYLMETGLFNNTGAVNFGYPQYTIDKINLGLTYVHDAQVKMALAYSDVHLGVNYSDLPMNADVSPDVPNYKSDWAKDAWHLSLDSKESAADRLANFIALDMGYTHMLDNPGPNYPRAALADLTIQNGPGVSVAGNGNDNIIVGTSGVDTLSGGDGNDVIVGGGGEDSLTGGFGSDTFYLSPSVFKEVQATEAGTVSDIRDIIADFEAGSGGDVVDVSAVLRAGGYTGTNAVSGGYITVTQQGADTVISYDQDGTAGTVHSAVALARLANTTTTQFDMASNLITQFPSGNALVLNAHQPPWARDDNFSSFLGIALQGNVLANNGIGADVSPEGLTLSTTTETRTTAQGGFVTINGAGGFTYAPALGFIGTDFFTYKLFDSQGGRDTGTVTIAVNPPAGALVGSGGDDILVRGNQNDIILGQGGNDIISGGSGNDTLYAGAGNDVLNGNSGNDILYAISGNNTLNGNDGDDALYAGTGIDILNGGNGNDILVAGTGTATLKGGAAADIYTFTSIGGAVDTVVDFLPNLGDMIDISRLMNAFNPATQSISDFVRATQQGSNTVLSVDVDGAFNGAYFVDMATLQNVQSFNAAALVASGNLVVSNGQTSTNQSPVARNDSFFGFPGQQISGNVMANNGNGADNDPNGDSLNVAVFTGQTTAGGSIDLRADGTFLYTPLAGFAGSDRFTYTLLDGHGGSATANVTLATVGMITGTNGDDLINGGSRDDIIKGLDGNDTLSGSGGNDTIYAGAGNDILNGNAGNDTLYAESGNNTLHGNDDNDTLYGGSGTDWLYGDNGNDILIAGTGQTTLTGGGGADTFLFMGTSEQLHTITDFSSSVGDKIDISNVLEGYDPASQVISDFVHATRQGTNTILSVDSDGTANGVLFSNLSILQGVQHFDVTAMIASGNMVV